MDRLFTWFLLCLYGVILMVIALLELMVWLKRRCSPVQMRRAYGNVKLA